MGDTEKLDLAVVGKGFAPCLMALALLAARPRLKLLVLTLDREVGGRHFELVLPERLPAIAMGLLDSAVVREWPGFLVNRAGTTEYCAERVALLDPVQLWLELRERVDDARLIVACGGVEWDGSWLSWEDGDARVAELVDLRALAFPERQSDIVAAGALADLQHPVLADFDAAGEAWHYLQYIPLGADRVAIERVAGSSIHPLLAGNDPAELPTVKAMAKLCELCAEVLGRIAPTA
ncbi:MAG TPA: hypothetical protein VHG29_01745 [Novosphingobium sp.]|nr:hypothetical protein [Novosphingobium sp.]